MMIRLGAVAFAVAALLLAARSEAAPVRIGVVGLEHDAAEPFLTALHGRPEAELVGIVETNKVLIDRYEERCALGPEMFHNNFAELLARAHPQIVVSFARTLDHPAVVAACAQAGLDVMLEKPLAINFAEARQIAAAGRHAGIDVMVDYETTWQPAYQSVFDLVRGQKIIGPVRQLVFRAGHRGPKEIGCSTNFLEWLTDPAQSGGGALVDFGCYGADMLTWVMEGRRPLAVTAVAQQMKPEVYPKVEDQATIILEYPGAQGVIQASWNWPYDVRALEVFGRQGCALAPQGNVVRVRKVGAEESEFTVSPPAGAAPEDEISFLAAVSRKQKRPSGLCSLDVNLTVMEILDAARESVRSGRRVELPATPPQ